jgi:AbrB family looped-hinge helix DNA binding protein
MAHSSTVSSKGQITLPKMLRERHHLKEGEVVLILDSEDGIVIRHGRPSLRGMLKDEIDGEGFEKDLKKLRKEWTV